MASLWKHPKSKYWTACYTNKDGKQVKRSTKQTRRGQAGAIALEWERIEQLARQGTVSTLQMQKFYNDHVDRITGAPLTPPRVTRSVPDLFAPSSPPCANYGLTAQEQKILGLMTQGLIKKEMADQLSLSYHTVDTHLRNIYTKLDIHTRTGAVSKAIKERLLDRLF
jgi:DNA-binding NarL/FixJ family response regulator